MSFARVVGVRWVNHRYDYQICVLLVATESLKRPPEQHGAFRRRICNIFDALRQNDCEANRSDLSRANQKLHKLKLR